MKEHIWNATFIGKTGGVPDNKTAMQEFFRNCHASFRVSHVESLRSSGLADAQDALFPVWADGAKHEISACFQTAVK
jgi:hypothetical protein